MSTQPRRMPPNAALRLMAVGEATADGEWWDALRLGPVVDDRTGKVLVVIDSEMLDAFVLSVNATVEAGGDISIDWNHKSERDGASMYETLGSVTGARRAGDVVQVSKRLNALGRGRVAADVGDDGKGVSLRTSPSIEFRTLYHPSEPGRELAPLVVTSLAVTDRPRQNGLAAISLSQHGVAAMLGRYEGADGSEREHREALASACIAALQARGLAPGDDGWMGLVDWNTEAAIVEVYAEGAYCVLYRIPYTEADDTITTGAPEVVERRVTYKPKTAASVAVQMSRPAGAHDGGTLMADKAQSTQTPEAEAPAPDKVTLAQMREERAALLLARDEAKAEADALKVELAQVKAGASTLERTVETLSASVAELKSRDAERAAVEAKATFEAAWQACLSKSAVVADQRAEWEADYTANPDTTLRCLARLAPGAAGITLGAPAGSPGPAADAPREGVAKVNVVQLCQERAEANGTDFESEYKRLRAELLQREVA